MSGFITERDLDEADEAFPGIQDYWHSLAVDVRPKTFLDLVAQYERGQR